MHRATNFGNFFGGFMNKKLNLAVAAAVMAMGASAANAGIVIPAGDWTIDVNGNVNAFYIYSSADGSAAIQGGLAPAKGANGSGTSEINTGLLPSWLGFTGKTRQNDLDVSWTISFQPGASSAHGLMGGSASEFRQANLTFGDKSWGTIKIGKDLGVFGANAILNDQTLLGVGAGAGAGGGTTTLGRIGTGFLYADFTGQINYTTPDWNGFQATGGIRQPWVSNNASAASAAITGGQDTPGFEGVVSYSWAGDFSGKVWLEGMHQDVQGIAGTVNTSDSADVFGLGASVNFSGVNLVGYYYNGEGVGTTGILDDGFAAGTGNSRDSDGGYVQASFKIPGVGTKLAASWGESNLDLASAEVAGTTVKSNEMWTIGAYHPLTSSVNLVAEYSRVESSNQLGAKNTQDIVDFGAILFF
jgi:predicted porin